MSRAFWFAAGLASGVYGVFKVKRTVENFTPDGIGARVAAFRRGAQVFTDEVVGAAREREVELLAELRARSSDDRLLPATSTNEHIDTVTAANTGESITDGHR